MVSATLAIAHDVSADEMKEALASLADDSFDGFVGDLHVSRESNGAEGLQSYRCDTHDKKLCTNMWLALYQHATSFLFLLRVGPAEPIRTGFKQEESTGWFQMPNVQFQHRTYFQQFFCRPHKPIPNLASPFSSSILRGQRLNLFACAFMTESHPSCSRVRAFVLFYFERWAITFLDLAANVPKLSVNATSWGIETSLVHVAGAVGEVSLGTETIREASARCCIEGNFSLTFDGVFVSDVDLDDNGTTRGDNLIEMLEDAITPGKIWKRRDPRMRTSNIANTCSTRHIVLVISLFQPPA